MKWRSDFEKVKCQDGTERWFLRDMKNIGTVFSIWAADTDYLIKTSLRISQNIAEGGGEAGIKNKADQILEELDDIHVEAVNKFNMSYLAFRAAACEKGAYETFIKSIDEIKRSNVMLRKLKMELDKLTQKKLSPSTQAKSTTNVDKYISGLKDFFKPNSDSSTSA